MKSMFVIVFLAANSLFAQGVIFEKGNWKEVLAKAKAENKHIFMDAYTTWCGPCRYMTNSVFPKPEMGAFFNANFINVKVQLDTTENDNEHIKSWYAEGHRILTEYNVQAFPTYLIFDPSGKIVHRMVGAADADDFIPMARISLDPEEQYYTLLDQYFQGKRDLPFLKKLAIAALNANDIKHIRILVKEYLSVVPDLLSKENIEFISLSTKSVNDPGFKFMLGNVAAFDKVNGAGTTSQHIIQLIVRHEAGQLIFGTDEKADWPKLAATLKKKYPAFADEALATAKLKYYKLKEDWANYQTILLPFMKKYAGKMPGDQLNDYAWDIFENCAGTSSLKAALSWSWQSIAKDENNSMYIDTYANLLYKLGNTKEAIDWQTKAFALADEESKADYAATLEKMKKGEKTWKH